MSIFDVRERYRKQPTDLIDVSDIDWSDDITRDLKVAAIYNTKGGQPTNPADRSNPATGDATGNYQTDQDGMYFKMTSTTGFDYVNPTTGSGDRTFLCLYKRITAETTGTPFHQGTDLVSYQRVTMRIHTASALRVDIENAGYTSSLTPELNKAVVMGFRLNGTTMADIDIFCDGTFESCTGTDTLNTTGTNFSFMYPQGGSGAGTQVAGYTYACYYWDRALRDVEILRLNDNFYDFIMKDEIYAFDELYGAGGAGASGFKHSLINSGLTTGGIVNGGIIQC